MAMGKRKRQRSLWVSADQLARGPGHPFYRRLNQLLEKHEFDEFVEAQCARFYVEKLGRPSLPPATYFRLLLIGYFEGIDSERGIAWRLADSMSLREFMGYTLSDSMPDHSTISRNRRLIDLETHQEVFSWVLKTLGDVLSDAEATTAVSDIPLAEVVADKGSLDDARPKLPLLPAVQWQAGALSPDDQGRCGSRPSA